MYIDTITDRSAAYSLIRSPVALSNESNGRRSDDECSRVTQLSTAKLEPYPSSSIDVVCEGAQSARSPMKGVTLSYF